MKPMPILSISAVAFTLAMSAQAQPSGGICAVEQVIACEPFAPCERGLPSAVNMPALIQLDIENKTVISRTTTGGDRSSAISLVEEVDDGYLITGIDEGNGWSMRISADTGRFTLASAHDGVAFTGFGVCAAQ